MSNIEIMKEILNSPEIKNLKNVKTVFDIILEEYQRRIENL